MKNRWHIINRLAKYQFRERFVLRWMLDAIEFFLVVASVSLASLLLGDAGPKLQWQFSAEMVQCTIYTMLLLVFWYAVSRVSFMSSYPRAQRFLSAGLVFVRGYFFIFLLLLLAKFVFSFKAITFEFIIVNIGIAFSLTLGFRILTMYFVRIYRESGYNLRRVLVIGDDSAQFLADTFLKHKEWGFDVRAIISGSRKIKRRYAGEIPVLVGVQNLAGILENQVIDEIFYSKRNLIEAEMHFIAKVCDEIGVIFRVQSAGSCFEPDHLQLKTFNHNGTLALVDVPSHNLSIEIKVLTDFIFSFFGLLALLPFLLVIAALIKIESQGPVFYKQERIGLRGRKFMLWKFRTMITNAEKLQEKLKAYNEADGPVFKIKDDPRITRLGRLLRRTGIDELPQLINVIKGDMSLIGPRPPVESEVKQYHRWQLRRLSVKPGITCIWQTAPNRNDILFEEWMKMDLKYIDNWSLKMDFRLVFKTIFVMFFATGR